MTDIISALINGKEMENNTVKEENTMNNNMTIETGINEATRIARLYDPFVEMIDNYTQYTQQKAANKEYDAEWIELLAKFGLKAYIGNYANLGDKTKAKIQELFVNVNKSNKEDTNMTTQQNPIINKILKEIAVMNDDDLKNVLRKVKNINSIEDSQRQKDFNLLNADHIGEKHYAMLACIFKINPYSGDTSEGDFRRLVYALDGDDDKLGVCTYKLNKYLFNWAKSINKELRKNGMKYGYMIRNIDEAQPFVNKLIDLGYLRNNTRKTLIVNYEEVDKAFARAGEFVTKLMQESH